MGPKEDGGEQDRFTVLALCQMIVTVRPSSCRLLKCGNLYKKLMYSIIDDMARLDTRLISPTWQDENTDTFFCTVTFYIL